MKTGVKSGVKMVFLNTNRFEYAQQKIGGSAILASMYHLYILFNKTKTIG